jgi:hypothetical protein
VRREERARCASPVPNLERVHVLASVAHVRGGFFSCLSDLQFEIMLKCACTYSVMPPVKATMRALERERERSTRFYAFKRVATLQLLEKEQVKHGQVDRQVAIIKIDMTASCPRGSTKPLQPDY